MEKLLTPEYLYELATEYINTLDRDKRVVAARYIAYLRENPKDVSDMGFLQFVESKLGVVLDVNSTTT